MKKYFCIFIFIFYFNTLEAQHLGKKTGQTARTLSPENAYFLKTNRPKFGINKLKNLNIEAGIVRIRKKYKQGNYARGKFDYFTAAALTLETDFTHIFAPKATFEILPIKFFGARIGLAPYFNCGKVDLRLMPEIGFSYAGWVNVYLGYNLHILGAKHEAHISKFRLSITTLLPFDH